MKKPKILVIPDLHVGGSMPSCWKPLDPEFQADMNKILADLEKQFPPMTKQEMDAMIERDFGPKTAKEKRIQADFIKRCKAMQERM